MTEATKGENARLVVERKVGARRERVFDAWGDAQGMKEWMCPGEGMDVPVAETDFRVGGKFRIDMRRGDTVFRHEGEYRELSRPGRLVFTWMSPATGGFPSVVTIDLVEEGEGTRLVLTHEKLPNEESATSHRGGWTAILEHLDRVLSG